MDSRLRSLRPSTSPRLPRRPTSPLLLGRPAVFTLSRVPFDSVPSGGRFFVDSYHFGVFRRLLPDPDPLGAEDSSTFRWGSARPSLFSAGRPPARRVETYR